MPQLIRSIIEELNAVFDQLEMQGVKCDREALTKTVQERLFTFSQKPIHLLAEWLDPTTYANALKQKQCERNSADQCLEEIVAENVELRGGSSVNKILEEFVRFKDGAWREDSHALMSKLEKY